MLIFFSTQYSFAQKIIIQKIKIEGNRKTKPTIIIRELTFHIGDTLTLEELKNKIADSKQNLQNLTLFNEIIISQKDSLAAFTSIFISVKERWYFYPIPVAELADRNFNVWWVEKKHDYRRLNVGTFLIKRNLRGRNETLTGIVEVGYTNYLSLQYDFPFIDKRMRKGLQLYSSVYSNKESAYITTANKQLFFRDENHFVKRRFQTGAIFRYRKLIHVRHNLEIGYTTYLISDSLVKANPDFLLNGNKYQQFGLLKYLFELDYRDSKAYPLNGYYLTASATRWGLTPWDNVNMSEIKLQISKYTPISKRLFFYQSFIGKTSYPSRQPYNIQRALGYLNDYVRGYEYYVIDGQHFAVLRNEIKYCLLKKTINSLADNLSNLPFNIYAKAFMDLGYVKDGFWFKNNSLNNQLLSGYGAGIDVATFYDLTFRFEFTTNHLKKSALYFALKGNL